MHSYVYDCVIHWAVHVGYSGSRCCTHNFGTAGFWNIAMEPWSGNSRVTADLTVLLCVLSKSNVERPYTCLRRGCKGAHIFGPLLLCLFIINKNKLVRQSAGYSEK